MRLEPKVLFFFNRRRFGGDSSPSDSLFSSCFLRVVLFRLFLSLLWAELRSIHDGCLELFLLHLVDILVVLARVIDEPRVLQDLGVAEALLLVLGCHVLNQALSRLRN